ncbi:histidinol dehydrogenase [Edaphobacillus lindanitolerans]|uniref:Histidinol dehydrogenase n=1 Tax=Edaphobacillus lindanitolerans TaxID=550447 RepID=A0A1U7PMD2_9BACI|nr:histidinol dehydrogenase [Edaphobacillus lindanitolerans]SIT71206.1 histidinol dehydrogenase [Edaphobacillus lindanitolerans]
MLSASEFMQTYKPAGTAGWDRASAVIGIMEDVRKNGDEALVRYTRQFDGDGTAVREIPAEELKTAFDALPDELRKALVTARENIESYQRKIKWKAALPDGVYPVYHPIRRAGIYVPGGKANYPSTVLMTAVPAKVAGVESITVVTPPPGSPVTLAACHLCGVDRVFTVGGVQAIAALAYGTETIPAVDKIAGPGNAYVALAKKLVYGDVGIDSVAGPSELAIVVDAQSNAEWAALDLLAQAEHDENARTYLISLDRSKLAEVEQFVKELSETAPRKAIILESLRNNHWAVLAQSRAEAVGLLNRIAPEHAAIQTADAEEYASVVTNAGALFIGAYSPEAVGDYSAGPSHVLPTGGNARFQSGLSVNDFLTANAVIRVSPDEYGRLAGAGIPIAEAEELYAHAASMQARLNEGRDE